MEKLIHDYKRILRELDPIYQRNIYQNLDSSHRIVGIVGPRGIGKTTYILNYLKQHHADSIQALYVSADDLYFSRHNLVDLAEKFINQYDGELLCIDEIHKYPGWAQELKNIYDKYRKLKVIFSGSSSVNLIKEKYDLSRRAVLRHLPGFSFREFLELRLKIKLPILKLSEVIEQPAKLINKIADTPKLLGFFKEYLQIGYYPIFLNHTLKRDIYEALLGVVEKAIYTDIASYYKLKTSTLPVFKKILYFIHTSQPGSININRLAKSLRKDHSDVANYLEMMRDTGLLRFLLIDKAGHALARNAEKIYLNNTSLMSALEHETGKNATSGSARELFILTNLENAEFKPVYSSVGDIKCDKYTFEIGGKSKDLSQIKNTKDSYLVLDDIVTGNFKRIPLYLFGFMY